jgi:putative effector of murein hydrolase
LSAWAVSGGVVALFLALRALSRRLNQHPLANPVLLTTVAIWLSLGAVAVPVARFEAEAWPLRWLFAPAIVALAHFIAARGRELVRYGPAVLGAVAVGSVVGMGSAVACAKLFGLGPELTRAIATKSVTSPFAIALMERLGGPAALAAGLSVATGIVGAVILPPLLRLSRIVDAGATGVAIGQASHAVGTEALARRNAHAAGYSGLAMALAGLAAGALLPFVWPWLA